MTTLAVRDDIARKLVIEAEKKQSSLDVFLEQLLITYLQDEPHAQEELRILKRAVEQSPTSIVITDKQGDMVYVNPKFTDLTGYTVEEAVGKNPKILQTGHTTDEEYEAMWGQLISGQVWHGEFLNKKKKGDLYWEQASISPVSDEAGEITHFVAVKEDITAFKELQSTFKRNAEDLRLIFELADVGIALADPSGVLIRANPAFCNMLEFTPDEIVGKNFREFTTEESLGREVKLIEKLIAKEIPFYQIEKQYVSKTGRTFWVDLTLSAHWDAEGNAPLHFIGIVKNIDEQKQTQESLRQSELRFRQMFKQNRAVQLLLDPDNGQIVDANEAACHYYGYDSETLKSISVYQINTMTVKEIHAVMQLMRTEAKGFGEFQHRLASGEVRDVEVYSGPIDIDDRQYLYSIVLDVHERKRAQNALRESEALYKSVVTAMREGVVVQDASGAIKFASKQAESALGLTQDQLMGLTSLDPRWKSIHEDGTHFPGETHPAMVALQTGKSQHNVIMGVNRPDGSLSWISINAEPIIAEGETKPYAVVATFNDITQEKQAREALAHSEANLNAILNNADISFVLLDEHRHIMLTNRRAQDDAQSLFGANFSIGDSFDDYIPDALREPFETNFSRALARELVKTERMLVNKNALEQYYEIRYFPAITDDKHVIGVCMSMENVTERKRAEEALRHSEESYRLLANNVTDIISKHTLEGVYTYVTPSALALLGYSPEELLGRSPYDFFHPDDIQAVAESHQAILDHGVISTMEYRMRSKDGEYVWFESASHVLKDAVTNEMIEIMAVSREISERKAAEEAIRRGEERYRSLFEKTSDGISFLDLDFAHLEVNQQAADMLGYSVEEMIGQPAKSHLMPEEHDDVDKRLELLLSGHSLPIYERRFKRKDGSVMYGEVNIALIRDEQGNPHHYQSIVRDISERKELEQKQIALLLEQERTKILHSFIEKASHEFRTPLSVIETALYLLQRETDNGNRAKNVEKIHVQIQALGTLLDNMLMLTRLDSINHYSIEKCSLSSILEQVIAKLQPIAAVRNITIQLQGELPRYIMANVEHLSIAFEHLLLNAIQFSRIDGYIRVRVESDDPHTTIVIEDDGVGMSPDEAEQAFERFYRKDKAHTTRGFGLGLPIAKQIISLHGGEIELKSQPGQGTSVRVQLGEQP